MDLEGESPSFPGTPQVDELQMIDSFFSAVFAEDTATLRNMVLNSKWPSSAMGWPAEPRIVATDQRGVV